MSVGNFFDEAEIDANSAHVSDDEETVITKMGIALTLYDQAKIKKLNAETKDKKQLTKLKKLYAEKTFHFMQTWCISVGILILFYVASVFDKEEVIPPEVMIAAFTSTTVVVGLVGFMIKGLFQVTEAKK